MSFYVPSFDRRRTIAQNGFGLWTLLSDMATPAATADTVDPATPLVFGVDVDPVLVGIIAVLLLLVFAVFLFIRKTLLSLSEGIRDGKRR